MDALRCLAGACPVLDCRQPVSQPVIDHRDADNDGRHRGMASGAAGSQLVCGPSRAVTGSELPPRPCPPGPGLRPHWPTKLTAALGRMSTANWRPSLKAELTRCGRQRRLAFRASTGSGPSPQQVVAGRSARTGLRHPPAERRPRRGRAASTAGQRRTGAGCGTCWGGRVQVHPPHHMARPERLHPASTAAPLRACCLRLTASERATARVALIACMRKLLGGMQRARRKYHGSPGTRP